MDSITDNCKYHFLCFVTIIQVKVISGHQVKKVKQKNRDFELRYMLGRMGEHRPLGNTAQLNIVKSSYVLGLKLLYPSSVVASEPMWRMELSHTFSLFWNFLIFLIYDVLMCI